MIPARDLLDLRAEWSLDVGVIEKDYVLGWLLAGIANHPQLNRGWVSKTLLREWAYRFAYPSSAHRSRTLPGFTRWYNRRRPHSSLGGRPPISRISQVCGYYS